MPGDAIFNSEVGQHPREGRLGVPDFRPEVFACITTDNKANLQGDD